MSPRELRFGFGVLRHDETHSRQAQDRPEARREYLGPAEEPLQQAGIWPRRAWTAPARQAFRLWPAASRQAEVEGLLRQHHREAVQGHLSRGGKAQGRHLREADRALGAAA